MTQDPHTTPGEPVYPTFPPDPQGGSAYPPPPPAHAGQPAHGAQPLYTPPPPAAPTHGYGAAALTPEQERNWAMLAHLAPLVLFIVSAGTLGFLGSLGIYLLYKDRGPFVRAHAATSLNFQIMVGIGLLISAVLMLVLIGFITYPLICLFAIIVHAIGAMKAHRGEWYRAPLAPQFIR